MTVQGRVYITGGAGFLGSHLCDRFLGEGYEVVCLDNLLTGMAENLEHLDGHTRFTFVRGDVTQPIQLEDPVDLVLHFASPASPRDYTRYPIHTLKAGALGTCQALDLARTKQASFVLASSSEIYGNPEVSPQPETYWGNVNPIGPRSVYDEAKRFAEAMAVAYSRAHGLDVRIVRIFNTYGPRMRIDDGRVLPTFMIQALMGLPLTVFGDGSQTRSFCYVGDMVEGIYRVATFNRTLSDALTVVNLGNPEEVTILELAHEIIEMTGGRSRVIFQPLPVDDPVRRKPDITRIKQLLGWEPKMTRREGLGLSLSYFRAALSVKSLAD